MKTSWGHQVYCGPFAAHILTGVDVDIIHDRINRERGEDSAARIVATKCGEIVNVIECVSQHVCLKQDVVYGTVDIHDRRHPHYDDCDQTYVRHKGHDTLTRFAKRTGADEDGSWLINVRGHFVVLMDGFFYDTGCPEGIGFDKLRRYKRSRVIHAWKVTDDPTHANL